MSAPVARRTALLQMGVVLFGLTACDGPQGAGPATASGTATGPISVAEARAAQAEGRALLIDVREPAEHAQGVAPGARLLPLSQLDQRLAEIPTDPKQPVLLICRTQNRSRKATEALRARGGYDHVRYVEGGMDAWVRQGGPTVMPAAR